MEIIDLKYCIEAKNADTELDEPCDCYRYYIDVAYNFKAYRISFCKHWKDFLYNKNIESCGGRNYSHKSINEELLKIILIKSGIYKSGEVIRYDHYSEPNFKEIKSGDVYFCEPLFVKNNNNRSYYHNVVFYNKIKASDFYRKLIDAYQDYIENDPDFDITYYGRLNPFSHKDSYAMSSAYEDQLKEFRKKIEAVNKKMAGRKGQPIAKELQNLIKLTIKEKKNETSKH